MGFLLGTDEAGLGPNLGPLLISATVWEAPDDLAGQDLFERLAHVISERPQGGGRRSGPRGRDGEPTPIVIADSKSLYSPEKGLRNLERALWATWGLLGYCPRTWRDVWRVAAPEALDEMETVPWYLGYDEPAPTACDGVDLAGPIEPLRAGLASADIRLVAIRGRAVFAHQLNELIDRYGSKGAALSHETLGLAAQMIESLPSGPISVICDKHGGRNRYADLLAEHFPDEFIQIHGEAGPRSTYRFGRPERRVEFCFRVRAEACLPVALASMASKYLRELAMRAFNRFWAARVPDLEPTAGYPLDAKRFRADIAHQQRQLNIHDRILWRQR
ncbi:MAG: hypothetical protein ABFC63_04240 [Thermoguttaceae bacterium]